MTSFNRNEKLVSVSLFGSSKKYLSGSIRLANSVSGNLPTWSTVFYLGNSVPSKHEDILISLGAKTIRVNEPENLSASAWRFRACSLGEPGWILFRDADSVVSRREASAVEQWVSSGLSAHIIRDHPFHLAPMLAGLWGLRPSSTPWFKETLEAYVFSESYGSDQEFLASKVYPRIVNDCLVHASFHAHEISSQQGFFETGSSRWGTFCGESISSNLIVRYYARIHRLLSPRKCRCVSLI